MYKINKNLIIQIINQFVTSNFVIPSNYQNYYQKCKINNKQFVDKDFMPKKILEIILLIVEKLFGKELPKLFLMLKLLKGK